MWARQDPRHSYVEKQVAPLLLVATPREARRSSPLKRCSSAQRDETLCNLSFFFIFFFLYLFSLNIKLKNNVVSGGPKMSKLMLVMIEEGVSCEDLLR